MVRLYQNPSDLVSGNIEFSDGDIFVAIQSYELMFEPAHTGGAYCSFPGLLLASGVYTEVT